MIDEQKLRQLAEAAEPWHMDTAGQTDEQQEEGTASVGVMNGDGEFLAVAVVDTGLYDMPALALPLAEYLADANPAAILSLLDELQALREERTAWRVTAENAEKDAARYRWLKSRPMACPIFGPDLACWDDHAGESIRGDEADAAIDAAMKDES